MFTDKNASAALVETALQIMSDFAPTPVEQKYGYEKRTETVDEQHVAISTRALGRVELINSVVIDWQGEEAPDAMHRFVIYSEEALGNIVLEPAQERVYLEGAGEDFFDTQEMEAADFIFAAQLLEKVREAKFELDMRRMQLVMTARDKLIHALETYDSHGSNGDIKSVQEGEFRSYDSDTFTDYSVDFKRIFGDNNELCEELLSMDVSPTEGNAYVLLFDAINLDIERMNRDEHGEIPESYLKVPEIVTYSEEAIAAFEVALKNILI